MTDVLARRGLRSRSLGVYRMVSKESFFFFLSANLPFIWKN